MRLGVALSLLVALLPTVAAASSRTARVSVTALSPVAVRGTSFLANERVTVTVSAKKSRTKTVDATALGTFTAKFPGFSIGRCQIYAVRAKGSRGSAAFLKVVPECAQPASTTGQSEPAPLYPSDPIPKKP